MLVTYKRTDVAVRTVRGVMDNLTYPRLEWHVADDGSDPAHLAAIAEAIGDVRTSWSNAERGGVGRSMNRGMAECLRRADYILWLEDDWECQQPFDLTPCVQVLNDVGEAGMVRLAYISPGIEGTLVGWAGRLWWRLSKGPTYTFTGHASLRHRRFCEAYGEYREDLPPGATELYMCGTFNNRQGPSVILPAWTGEWGPFSHIGSESLKDVAPNG
jgi:hypothetical protein